MSFRLSRLYHNAPGASSLLNASGNKSAKSNGLNCGQFSQSANKSSDKRVSEPDMLEFEAGFSSAKASEPGVRSDFVLSVVLLDARWFMATALLNPCIIRCRLRMSFADAVRIQPLAIASSVPAVALMDSRRRAHSWKRIIWTSTR